MVHASLVHDFSDVFKSRDFHHVDLVGWLAGWAWPAEKFLIGDVILDVCGLVSTRPWKSCLWIMNHSHSNQFSIQISKGFFLFSTTNLSPVLYTLVIGMQIKWPNKSLNIHDIGSSNNADRKSLNTLSNHKLQVKFWIPRGHNFQMQVWGPDTPDI